MIKCPVCNKIVLIRLMPDYASSGMWCHHCGVGYGDPLETFSKIPKGLVDLVDGWNWLWEIASDNKDINREHFEKIFRSMGKELASQVNAYYNCVFDETKPVFY